MAPPTHPAGAASATNTNQNNGLPEISATFTIAPVNRKKQKRREKQAARLAAVQETSSNGFDDTDAAHGHLSHQGALQGPRYYGEAADYGTSDADNFAFSDEDNHYTYNSATQVGNGDPAIYASTSTRTRNGKKKKVMPDLPNGLTYDRSVSGMAKPSFQLPSAFAHPPPPPPPPPVNTSSSNRPVRRPIISDEGLRTLQRRSEKPDIWDTSSLEERARIKDFWLSLGEEERRSLVKIEKEAVLRKMKEQQKHHCSCTVCGRKRTAIEEELEVLYDAYYEELEQYANPGEQDVSNRSPMPPPPRRYSQQTNKPLPDRLPPLMSAQKAARGRIEELPDEDEEDFGDEDADEEQYSDDEYEEDEYSVDETDELPPNPAADFFTFGNSLTVKGGILTVADDLLENDGRKFIQMMEQLAERRMQREEELSYTAYSNAHVPGPHAHNGHTHAPSPRPPEEDEYDEEDEDEYDSQDDEYDEEDEMDAMTEEQRMEEGRRMFQIFAARMFEQRVLTAYKERVARERQEKLIEDELNEKSSQAQQSAKRARDAEKKRQKKQQQKQKQQEEKAKKEEIEAAKAAAVRAEEESKQEEQRQKREEQRKKKEAERKSLEEEKLRKEAEKQRRQQQERERQQEAERKQREQKADEKRRREEAKAKEREQREAKEREAREKKAVEERRKKEKDEQAQAGRKAVEQRRRVGQEAQTFHTASAIPDVQHRLPLPAIVALPPSIKSRVSTTGQSSPQLKVATPVLPKAPTPVRPKDGLPQQSQTSIPHTPESVPPSKQSSPPKSNSTQQSMQSSNMSAMRTPLQPLHSPFVLQGSSANSIPPPPGMHLSHGPPFSGVPAIAPSGFPANQGAMLQGMLSRTHASQQIPVFSPHVPLNSIHQRPFMHQFPGPAPPGMGPPSMQNHSRSYAPEPSAGFHHHILTSGAQPSFAPPRETMPSHSRQHSRQHSVPLDVPQFVSTPASAITQPIARPAPIKRPASVKPQEHGGETQHKPIHSDMDDLSNHLGSSVLLDDNDDPLPVSAGPSRRAMNIASSLPSSSTAGLIGSPFKQNHASFNSNARAMVGDEWRPSAAHFASSGSSNASGWGSAQGSGWSPFPMPLHRPGNPRPVTVRMLACQACKILSSGGAGPNGGFHDINDIVRYADSLRQVTEPSIQLSEVRDILDTEGDTHNGGGSFIISNPVSGRMMVKWEPDASSMGMGLGLGEIGSPVVGSNVQALNTLGTGRS